MKRFSPKAIRVRSQKGISIIDALFAMLIAGMIAAAVTTSLGTWFNVRNMSANQDAANQYAQGVIAKTNALDWDKLGFDSTTDSFIESDAALPECPTAFRPMAQVGDKYLKTVVLNGEPNPVGVAQTAVAELRGKKYCVLTDVTWNSQTASGSESPNASATKNISVTVSWKDNEIVRSISVNSIRTPGIGEAIPSGISEVRDVESSPIKSFSVTKAYHDGTNGTICYIGNWNDTSDIVSMVGSAGVSLSPVSVSNALSGSDRNVEQCLATGDQPNYAYYGLTVGDEAGIKFVGSSDYQYPGNKVTRDGNKISWNTYPASGQSKYRIMKSDNQGFTDAEVLDEVTGTSYELPESDGTFWVRVDTANDGYAVTASSNAIEVHAPSAD